MNLLDLRPTLQRAVGIRPRKRSIGHTCYLYDIEDILLSCPLETDSDIVEDAWQYYFEQVLRRELGLNIVRTQNWCGRISVWLKYIEWKIGYDPLFEKFSGLEVREHLSEECWVYIEGTQLLLVYY
jgi:hypothetical protein